MRIYINEHGAKVGISNGKLIVTKNGKKLKAVPAELVENLIVNSSVQITSQALVFLFARNAGVLWINSQGRTVCSISENNSGCVERRKAQYSLMDSKRFCGAFARRIVSIKIHGQRSLLSRLNEELRLPEAEKAISALISAEEKCSFGSISALRGAEGNASRVYFSALGFFIDKCYGFTGRNRRPPKDCANAALSFSYSLLYNAVDIILRNRGFDTFAGFMHAAHSGHRALASDFMEMFRAEISDRASLDFLKSADIETDFAQEGKAVYLSDAGRKKLIPEFERCMSANAVVPDGYEQSMRGLILYHADILASAVDKNDISYFKRFGTGENNAHSGDI